MASEYYKACPELDRCNELIDRYWYSGQYDKCFAGHLELARQGYPLAECQVGYFYLKGLGTPFGHPSGFAAGGLLDPASSDPRRLGRAV